MKKQQILDVSLRLFNTHGLANVRLQQIADEVGMSVGNLAYHFRNKESILKAVNAAAMDYLATILSKYRIYPNLIDFDSQLREYYQFIQQYPFYFTDLLEVERTYPDLDVLGREQALKVVRQIRNRFDFDVQRGVLQPEVFPGQYDHVTTLIWMTIAFWRPQQHFNVANNDSERYFKTIIWTQILPYFTEKGRNEFQALIAPVLSGAVSGK